MLGAIAGDIIGSRFEGCHPPSADFHLFDAGCRFTDDTVCTLAIAEALLEGGDFAASLRAFVRRHPRRGYGGMFLKWAFTDDAPAYGSWGNGAPMRTAAIGWLCGGETEVLRRAAEQAQVSHDHPDAVAGSQAVALSILLLRTGTPRPTVRSRIAEQFGYDLDPATALQPRGFDVSAKGTVPPALTAALSADGWEQAVRTVISLGGDTDTLGCICGAVAEAAHGVPDDIAEAAGACLTQDLLDVLHRASSARSLQPQPDRPPA